MAITIVSSGWHEDTNTLEMLLFFLDETERHLYVELSKLINTVVRDHIHSITPCRHEIKDQSSYDIVPNGIEVYAEQPTLIRLLTVIGTYTFNSTVSDQDIIIKTDQFIFYIHPETDDICYTLNPS